MNSKEALKKLFFDNEDIKVDITLNDRKVCEIYNTIKQDLDRLEKLEKENKELRKSIKSWNENAGNLLKENTKLKKAIDYLKDNFKLKISESYNEDGTIKYILFSDRTALKYGLIVREENIELLKEVLKND